MPMPSDAGQQDVGQREDAGPADAGLDAQLERRDGAYGSCDQGVPIGGSACNPDYPGLVFECVDPEGDPRRWDSAGAMWASHPCPGGCEDTGRLCDGYQTCVFGVAVGHTACRDDRRDLVFTCVEPEGHAERWDEAGAMWSSAPCPGGCTNRGECDGTRTCENGVPVGATACDPDMPLRVFICDDPEGDPTRWDESGAMWISRECPQGCEGMGGNCEPALPI